MACREIFSRRSVWLCSIASDRTLRTIKGKRRVERAASECGEGDVAKETSVEKRIGTCLCRHSVSVSRDPVTPAAACTPCSVESAACAGRQKMAERERGRQNADTGGQQNERQAVNAAAKARKGYHGGGQSAKHCRYGVRGTCEKCRVADFRCYSKTCTLAQVREGEGPDTEAFYNASRN